MNDILRVLAVHYDGGYRLKLEFSNGASGIADLDAFLSVRPKLAALRDLEVFSKAFLDLGTVCWPGGLDLAPERLYALAFAGADPFDVSL